MSRQPDRSARLQRLHQVAQQLAVHDEQLRRAIETQFGQLAGELSRRLGDMHRRLDAIEAAATKLAARRGPPKAP